MANWLLLYNPVSNSGMTEKIIGSVRAELDSSGIEYTVQKTFYSGHAKSLCNEAADMGRRHFLVCGGDGTVHEVLDGILSWCSVNSVPASEFYLAAIPNGSGNDWVKTLGITGDVRLTCSLIRKGSFLQQDVTRGMDSQGKQFYIANGCGTGWDSNVCDRVNKLEIKGHFAYVKALVGILFHPMSLKVRISCDGRVAFEGEVFSVAFGVGKYSGGGIAQCPLADPTDGMTDLFILKKKPVARIFFTALVHLLLGKIYKSPDAVYIKGRSFYVEALDKESEDIIEADGEVLGRIPMKVDVLPEKINVLYNPE